MRKFIGLIALVTCLLLLVPRGALAYLADVAGHWSNALLTALEARGVIAGDRAGNFYPDDLLTRAELARILVTGLGYSEDAARVQDAPSRFVDVSRDHPDRGYIELLWELGLAQGYPDGRFGPEEPVTRAEMAVVLVRAAGLEQRATVLRTARLAYRDAAQIPGWAVGAVAAAVEAGLMTGDDMGWYRPADPVTRAEGAAAFARILDRQGLLFDLEGTLVAFDPREAEGVVRTPMGEEYPFSLAVDAAVLRGGQRASPPALRVGDQVWLILNDAGQVRFVEAWYADMLAEGLEAAGDGKVRAMLADGERKVLTVQPGALAFVNGRPATLSDALGKGPTYLTLDARTGAVRYVDAVRTSVSGTVALVEDDRIWLEEGEAFTPYPLADDAILVLDGQPVAPYVIEEGDRVDLALDADGQITYAEIVR